MLFPRSGELARSDAVLNDSYIARKGIDMSSSFLVALGEFGLIYAVKVRLTKPSSGGMQWYPDQPARH